MPDTTNLTVVYKGTLTPYVYNVSAVSEAFGMVSKVLFERAGGFSVDYPRTFYMADLCLRFRAMGYNNAAYGMFNVNYFHQSHPLYADTIGTFTAELAKFKERYAEVLSKPDPYLNPNIVL
jgi:hypothetical protein